LKLAIPRGGAGNADAPQPHLAPDIGQTATCLNAGREDSEHGYPEWVIGSTIAHYRIVGRLGVGGMGVVYEAQDQRLPRRVALKFLPDDMASDPDAVRRFKREADTIARLNHANICTIYDLDEHEGRPFIAMERVEGMNLKAWMARKTLETAEILGIATDVASALEAAHAEGIVHRDIKPGNIVVSESGRAKVLDFGLARRFPVGASTQENTDGSTGSTIPGRPVGTANYMAPERILQLPLDARCDLFSLGVVMYEMATGRLPFTGASPAETVANILEKTATPLTELAPGRPVQLQRIVDRLTAKRADDRYQSASNLLADLDGLKANLADNSIKRLLSRLFSR
jgi:serine/threonine protein kinase